MDLKVQGNEKASATDKNRADVKGMTVTSFA